MKDPKNYSGEIDLVAEHYQKYGEEIKAAEILENSAKEASGGYKGTESEKNLVGLSVCLSELYDRSVG
eukprot:1063622-Amorphochlora_amoeboformis.AAC.1